MNKFDLMTSNETTSIALFSMKPNSKIYNRLIESLNLLGIFGGKTLFE